MIVEMCMSRDVETIPPEASLFEGIRRMTERRIRRLVVTQGRAIAGIACHRDIVSAFPPHINPFSAVAQDAAACPGTIASVMKHPVITIEADQPIELAAERMTRHHIGSLPVTLNHRLVGILTESDIFRTLSRLLAGSHNATRITFDLTRDDHALDFLVANTRELGLELLSFISFRKDDRRLGVAHVLGPGTTTLIDRLWNSGRAVVNVLRNTP